jgi:ribonuclease BN (tRNA processing enzyme)
MILNCLATGSKANCYVLKRDNGEMLILDAGLPISEIKKGIGFDVANLKGAVITHSHKDHSLSAEKLKQLTPVWEPYLSEQKRQHTHLGDFDIQCFDLPHNGVENRGFIIRVDGQTICYMTDLEYCPYSLTSQNIDTMIVECNYMMNLVPDDLPNLQHKVLGHCELDTTIGILQGSLRTLKHIILVHMGQGTLDREKAMGRIRDVVPEYITVTWARADRNYDISACPF